MTVFSRRAPRRPAPPSVRLYDDPDWREPADVAPGFWRRLLSSIELVALVTVLGLLLTITIGIVMVMMFFMVDYLVS